MIFSATPATLLDLRECQRTHHLAAYVDKIFGSDRASKCWRKEKELMLPRSSQVVVHIIPGMI